MGSKAIVLAAVASALYGCIVPASNMAYDFEVAEAYKQAWSERYGWSDKCESAYLLTSIEFVDIAHAPEECKKTLFSSGEAYGCFHYSIVDSDAIITIPYNFDSEYKIVHELTHLFLLCSTGDAGDSHSGEVWTWRTEWTADYLRNWSAVEAVK